MLIWDVRRRFIACIYELCGIQEKPTAQTAHLVYADTQIQS